MNMLTLKWAELLTAWSLATPEERQEFQKRHGPIVEPPTLKTPFVPPQRKPIAHDEQGPLYKEDLDACALRDGKLVRAKT